MQRTIVVSCILLFFALAGCADSKTSPRGDDVPQHHSEEGFRNPYLQAEKRGFFKYLKMRYFSDEEFADNSDVTDKIPTTPADLQQILNPQNKPQITWLGHATMLIQYAGVNILTDPIFSDRASPVSFAGPKRFNKPALEIKDLPPIDFVLLSHNHYDHLDKASIKAIGNGSKWLVPLGNRHLLEDAGIKAENIIDFDWWDAKQFAKITITSTPAQHWSARNLWDRNEALWSSWMIQYEGFTFWYSGDTGYNPYQFKEIGSKFKDIDLALISIGAYAPRWFMKVMHINPEEAVQIHEDIGSQYSIAVQWGTFVLTSEPLDEPPKKLKEALDKKGISPTEFEIIKIGETKILNLTD